MGIQAIQNGIVNGVSKAGNAVVDAVKWCGRSVVYLGKTIGSGVESAVKNYLIPSAKKTWAFAEPKLSQIVDFLRTGYGVGSSLALGGLVLMSLSDSSTAEDNVIGASICRVASCALFVLAGLAFGQQSAILF